MSGSDHLSQPAGWAVLLLWLAGCADPARPREVRFVGADFAFQGPDTVAPGRTIFRFTNAGTLNHELGLGLLRPGVTGAQALAAELHGADVDSIYESDGLLFAPSGAQVDMGLVIDLKPGRNYVLICTLDAGPKNTPHVQLGMFKSLTVRPR